MEPTMTDDQMIEAAWGVIANAAGGDWDKESPEWQAAADRWRTHYLSRAANRLSKADEPTVCG